MADRSLIIVDLTRTYPPNLNTKLTLVMKLFLLLLVSFIFINNAHSQFEIKFEIGRKRKITKVEVEGGPNVDTTVRAQIIRRLNTLKVVGRGAKKGTYIVRVNFIVDKRGNISDVECITDPGYGMGAESVRAIKASSAWNTGGPVEVKPYKH